MCKLGGRDHNATSYSTETRQLEGRPFAFIISRDHNATSYSTETALRPLTIAGIVCRDHNATSYSTETQLGSGEFQVFDLAEIITLRAIALKLGHHQVILHDPSSRDHNATSYSTET